MPGGSFERVALPSALPSSKSESEFCPWSLEQAPSKPTIAKVPNRLSSFMAASLGDEASTALLRDRVALSFCTKAMHVSRQTTRSWKRFQLRARHRNA